MTTALLPEVDVDAEAMYDEEIPCTACLANEQVSRPAEFDALIRYLSTEKIRAAHWCTPCKDYFMSVVGPRAMYNKTGTLIVWDIVAITPRLRKGN